MNEIEKMYELADCKKLLSDCTNCKKTDCTGDVDQDTCVKLTYSPFTAKEQLELIKWLAKNKFVVYNNLGGWHVGTAQTYSEELGIVCKYSATNIDLFEEALARLINNLWQDLTKEEKQQVKEILE